jgi:hypothetical protein
VEVVEQGKDPRGRPPLVLRLAGERQHAHAQRVQRQYADDEAREEPCTV